MTVQVNGRRLNYEENIRKHPDRNLYQGRVWVDLRGRKKKDYGAIQGQQPR